MTRNQTDPVSESATAPSDQENFNLCAVGGETKVDTDLGTVPAKLLTDQHRLRVLCGGFKAIRWVERLELDQDFLAKYPNLKPLCIPAGHFRPDVPRRDILLSRNTVIRVNGDPQNIGRFGAAHLFIPKNVAWHTPNEPITYIVIGCAGPTMLRAEGMWVSC